MTTHKAPSIGDLNR